MNVSSESVRVLFVVVLYSVLAGVLAGTRPPHGDEGQFVNGAAEIAVNQRLAMPMWREWAPGIEDHVYVTTPLYFVLLGAWFKVFGIGLISMRLFSVFAGLAFLIAWYLFLRTVTRDRLTPFLGLLVLGLHYDFINLTNTRYDGVAATFSACALASYVCLREGSLRRAILVSNCFLAAAVLTHPFGVFGGVGLSIFVITLDRRNLRPAHFAWAALPYVVGFSCWGVYIAQDPENFVSQMSNNSSGRLGMWTQPLAAIVSEIRERYLVLFGGWRDGVPLVMRIKTLLLPLYLVGYLGCWFTPSIRRNQHVRALLWYALAAFLLLTYIDGTRLYIYLVHAVPLYLVCLALWLRSLLDYNPAVRAAAWAVVAGMALFTMVTIGYRARLDGHGRLYLPALGFLQQHVQAHDLVMATGEFGVGLGFAEHVLDDHTLGYKNGMDPEYFVADEEWPPRLEGYRTAYPDLYRHLKRRLDTYEKVYETKVGGRYYEIYQKPE